MPNRVLPKVCGSELYLLRMMVEVGVFEEAEWQWPEDIVMPIQRIMHHPKRP